MKSPYHTGKFQNPDCPDFNQKSVRILRLRILSFEIPPLKSRGCTKTRNPDWHQIKSTPDFDYSCSKTTSYVKTQNPVLPPLKGKVSSPLKAGETLPSPGPFCRGDIWSVQKSPIPFFTRRQWTTLPNKHATAVFCPSSQPRRNPLMTQPDLKPDALGAHISTTTTPMDRTFLTIDLGTTTGWALRSQNGLITSGTVSFRPGRYDGGGMRYLRFQNWLGEMERLAGPIATIWFEEVRRHAGTDAAHVYGGLMATLTAWAETRGVPYQGVPVGTIKKHATGKGNASKAMMIEAAQARGYRPADDNEADAIAILHWALETKGGMA